LHGEEKSFDIRAERLVKVFLGDRSQGSEFAAAGVGEDNINTPCPLLNRRIQPVEIRKARHVALNSSNVLADQLDGLIEFTIPAATLAFAELTAAAGLVHVIGTTGHSAEEEALIAKAAKRATIVKSGNMSLGVNLLAALVKRVAATLNDDYDIEIFEMHHNKKIDAPSGTALLLGRAAAEGRGIDLAKHSARGRDGMTGARKPGDIGFASLRGGTVVGEHSVIFAGPAERVELTHRAEDRLIFARGALHAALWARGKKPGLYSMADVLGLGDK